MNAVFYLKTCSTCIRILKELNLPESFNLIDIKSTPITTEQLEHMHHLSGSYEALFSKRAQLYKMYDLKNKNLGESEYKKYILEHYTFLKRPVIIVGDSIFIGNSKATVELAKQKIHE